VGTQTVTTSNSGSQNLFWECIIPQAYLFSLGNISRFWWMENSNKNMLLRNTKLWKNVVDGVQSVDDINTWFLHMNRSLGVTITRVISFMGYFLLTEVG
jgi:hypothetical protein